MSASDYAAQNAAMKAALSTGNDSGKPFGVEIEIDLPEQTRGPAKNRDAATEWRFEATPPKKKKRLFSNPLWSDFGKGMQKRGWTNNNF